MAMGLPRPFVGGFVVAALLALTVGAPVGATTAISGGNALTSRAYLDTYANFVIVDTNHPISGAGMLTSWSFWAGTTGGVQLVVVRDDGTDVTVVGESPVVSSPTTGGVATEALSPALPVQAGDLVGLYFQSTGVVPFDGIANAGTTGTVLYTVNGYGDPAVGATLAFDGAVTRTYSVSVSGVAPYDFAGFYKPVDNDGWNTAKAGSAIPVKFSLGGNQGLDIFMAGYPKATQVLCPSSSSTGDLIEETVTAGGSSLTYDATSDQYVYVWKTAKTWAGKCFHFDLGLNDLTSHGFDVQFTR
jgi:hypothetical protein